MRKHLPALSRIYGINGWHVERMPVGELNAYLTDLNQLLEKAKQPVSPRG